MLASNPTKKSRPRPEDCYDPRVDNVISDVGELKEGLDECRDVKGRMQVLDERTAELLKKADKNSNALFGTNGTPGMNTRISNVERDVSEIKGGLQKVLWAIIIGGGGLFIEQIIQLILTHGPTAVNAAK